MSECFRLNGTSAERAQYWRAREAEARAFLQSNCLSPQERLGSECWAQRYARLAEQYEQDGKERS